MADPGTPLPFEGLNAGQLENLRQRRATDLEGCFYLPHFINFGHLCRHMYGVNV